MMYIVLCLKLLTLENMAKSIKTILKLEQAVVPCHLFCLDLYSSRLYPEICLILC